MDYKMKAEINQLVKKGIHEDLATISVCKKYNKCELVEHLVTDISQEQELLNEELKNFKQFETVILEE